MYIYVYNTKLFKIITTYRLHSNYKILKSIYEDAWLSSYSLKYCLNGFLTGVFTPVYLHSYRIPPNKCPGRFKLGKQRGA